MRVLLVSDAYYPYPSGVSELTHNRMIHLKKYGLEVDILTANYGKDDNKYSAYRIGKILKIPANGSYITMTYLNKPGEQIRDFFKNKKYDVIHLSGPFPPDLSYWVMKYAPKNIPIVAEFQAASDFVLRDFYKEGTVTDSLLTLFVKQSGIIFNKIYRKDYQRVNKFVAISEAAKIFFSMFIKEDYDILPCGVDTERFSPEGDVIEEIKSNPYSILFLGRLDKRKGLNRLIDIIPDLVKENDRVRLYVGGKGPLYDKYRKKVKDLKMDKYIKFLGFIPNDELPSLYRSSSLYISPATGGETFGIVLIEAMASGVPVIASDIPGYREVIKNDYNGILVDTLNKEKFLNAVKDILFDDNKRKKIAQKGLDTALNSYSWDVIIPRTIKIYNSL